MTMPRCTPASGPPRACTIPRTSTTPAASASSSTSRAESRTRSWRKASQSWSTSCTAAPAAARPTPATAPASDPDAGSLPAPGVRARSAFALPAARRVRRRPGLPAARRRRRRDKVRALSTRSSTRRARSSSAGATCRPTTARSAPRARSVEPLSSRSSSAAAHDGRRADVAFERKLYVIRKRVENAVDALDIPESKSLLRPEPVRQHAHLQGHADGRSARRRCSPT